MNIITISPPGGNYKYDPFYEPPHNAKYIQQVISLINCSNLLLRYHGFLIRVSITENATNSLLSDIFQARSEEFISYSKQILLNAKALAEALMSLNYKIVSGGTDSHLLLIDLKSRGIDGARVDWVCEHSGIVANKNTVPGDKSAMNPGGLRLGT